METVDYGDDIMTWRLSQVYRYFANSFFVFKMLHEFVSYLYDTCSKIKFLFKKNHPDGFSLPEKKF